MSLLESAGIRLGLTYLHTHTQSYQADGIFKLVESVD